MRSTYGGYSTRSFAYVHLEDEEAEVNITAGNGLVASPTTIVNTGSIAMPDVGSAGTYLYPTSITTDAQGRASSLTAGTAMSLTSATAPIVLTPSTITSAGTIGLQQGVVTSGIYQYPSEISVDTYGRIYGITTGDAPTSLVPGQVQYSNLTTTGEITGSVTIESNWLFPRLSACGGAAAGMCADPATKVGGASGGVGSFIRDMMLLPGDVVYYSLGRAATGGTTPFSFGSTPGATQLYIVRNGLTSPTIVLGAASEMAGGVASIPVGTVSTNIYNGPSGALGGVAGSAGLQGGFIWGSEYGPGTPGSANGTYSSGASGASSLFGKGADGMDSVGGSQTHGSIAAAGSGGMANATANAHYGSDSGGSSLMIQYYLQA